MQKRKSPKIFQALAGSLIRWRISIKNCYKKARSLGLLYEA